MKPTIISLIVAIGIILGAFVFIGKNSQPKNFDPAQNVTIVDGMQIIEIDARGGYFPRKSTAKAGIPTILRFKTAGTFDCSSSVRIPSLDISKMLPQSGATDIDLGDQKSGVLQGSCGMGMYPFEIDFQS